MQRVLDILREGVEILLRQFIPGRIVPYHPIWHQIIALAALGVVLWLLSGVLSCFRALMRRRTGEKRME